MRECCDSNITTKIIINRSFAMSFTSIRKMVRNLKESFKTQSLDELKKDYERISDDLLPCIKRIYSKEIDSRMKMQTQ